MEARQLNHYTEVRFASFLSGGFTTMAMIDKPEKKLAKATLCTIEFLERFMIAHTICSQNFRSLPLPVNFSLFNAIFFVKSQCSLFSSKLSHLIFFF